jgi:hypothetical protein
LRRGPRTKADEIEVMYIPIVFPRSFEDGAIFEATALAAGKKEDLAIARRMLMGKSQT